jgi:hypothetical protein
VSCPDWTTLAAHRHERRGVEPEGWRAALEHFDSCSACRREALAADPTLVFRRMPGMALTPADEAAEVDSMRQAVAAMRTASRLESSRRTFAGRRRWAAAAVLAVAALSLGRDGGPIQDHGALATSFAAEAAGPPAGRLEPAVSEDLSPDFQVDSDEMSVVMLYGDNFGSLLDV